MLFSLESLTDGRSESFPTTFPSMFCCQVIITLLISPAPFSRGSYTFYNSLNTHDYLTAMWFGHMSRIETLLYSSLEENKSNKCFKVLMSRHILSGEIDLPVSHLGIFFFLKKKELDGSYHWIFFLLENQNYCCVFFQAKVVIILYFYIKKYF